MAYDNSHNPFSSTPGRAEPEGPWGEPDPRPERGGLQLPGETDANWGDGWQRPSPLARRRNQWRQHQQLTPDFGTAPREPEPGRQPLPRNASLPTFKRAAIPQPTVVPAPPERSAPTVPGGRGPRPSGEGLQMHPHSYQPNGPQSPSPQPPLPRPQPNPLANDSAALPGGNRLPSNVTPLRRPNTQTWSKAGPRGPLPAGSAAAQAARSLVPTPETTPEAGGSPRRSRAATARRRLANPPLPLLYLIRLIILGVGVAAIAGTLLSVLSPANVASSRDGNATPAAQAGNAPRVNGPLVQGSTAATTADLRLTSEIAHLKGELEQLATLTPGLTPAAFAVDLDSGQYVDLGGAEALSAASTIKVPILVAFLQQVDAGTMALNQSLVLREEYVAGGSGTLRGEAVGNEYTALEVATRMIVGSDNTATNMMIAALGGGEALNQTFAAWGLGQTLLRNPLPDLEGTNMTSAKDLALIMALIDQGGLLTPRSRDRLFSIMQRTENTSLIPSGIGDRSLTANKTGDIGSMLGDVALVDVPNGKRYALAVLVQRPTNDGRASELIRRMTETVHGEMAQPVAPVGNPNAAAPQPLSPPGEFEVPDPSALPPGDPTSQPPLEMTPTPERAPARDEIPPG